ncbi:VOC family protein [Deinococcus sp. UYEF24]
MIQVTPHLNFRGTARSAMEFYQSVFGGETAVFTFRDAHNVQSEGGLATAQEADQIMWGQVSNEKGFRVMLYDVPSALSYDPGDRPVYVSVRSDTADELKALWNGLKEGATILADLGPAPWGTPLYGMLKDKFGVTWVMDVQTSS